MTSRLRRGPIVGLALVSLASLGRYTRLTMSGVDADTQLEALRYLHDSTASSFNTTLGFFVLASGWLISSSRTRRAISTHRPTKMVFLAVVAGGWLLLLARLWMLNDRSAHLAATIDADPSVIAAYEVGTWDTLGNSVVATVLAGALFVLVLRPAAPIASDG
jgi:hypothetical protein